jgi:hypothetical protein
MAKQATNIRLFTAEQIPHPGANQQKANARPWEQVQLKMPDKGPGGGWAAMELIETLVLVYMSKFTYDLCTSLHDH